jgi:uncharacterized membrane protein YuzA (DUF378 family)
MERYNALDWIGWGLSTIGAINWGLVGAAKFNLVHSLFGRNPMLERAIYTAVGLSGLYSAFRFVQFIQAPRELRERVTSEMRRVA